KTPAPLRRPLRRGSRARICNPGWRLRLVAPAQQLAPIPNRDLVALVAVDPAALPEVSQHLVHALARRPNERSQVGLCQAQRSLSALLRRHPVLIGEGEELLGDASVYVKSREGTQRIGGPPEPAGQADEQVHANL